MTRVISNSKPAAAATRSGSAAVTGDRLSTGRWLLVVSSTLWIVQAGALSYSIQQIADRNGIETIAISCSIFVVVGLLKSYLDAFASRSAYQTARQQLSTLRERAILGLARRSPINQTGPSSGEVASVMGEQAELVIPYFSRFWPARLKATIVPMVILLFVFPVSWLTALLLIAAAPLIPIFMALIGWQAKVESEKQLTAMGGLNGFLLDRLRGLATLRSLGAIDATSLELRQNANSLKTRTMSVLKIAFLSSAVLELFSALGVAMVAVYVGFSLLGDIQFGMWGRPMTLGSGLFLLLLAPAFFEPLRDLSSAWHDRAAGEAAIDALARLGGDETDIEATIANPGLGMNRRVIGAVVVEDVTYRYDDNRPLALDHVSLNVASGQHVALMGASGSGKSTLMALLAGLAEPKSGRILISGVPLSKETADGLRHRIAWIGQKPHIFAGTMARNISLGSKDMTAKDVLAALGVARLLAVAQSHGDRPLGEGGIGLSGGEIIRLAIARAAAAKDIEVILADEPTAHLDSETARQVIDSLLALAKGRTLIVATHDPVLARRMDRLVEMEWQPVSEAAE